MQTKSRCHHRYMLNEDAFFVTKNRIELFRLGEGNPNYHVYGHVDFPLEKREVSEPAQKENRFSGQGSQQHYVIMLNLL